MDAAAESGRAPLPQTLALDAWPNPSNAVFSIRYELARAGAVRLRVYDLTGRLAAELLDARAERGRAHAVVEQPPAWPAASTSCASTPPTGARTRKLLLLK